MEAYELLESEFANFNGISDKRRMVACSSGTSALHLALETMCLPPGSIVLIPEYTMIACARACTLAGLQIRTVDCGKDSFNVTVEELEKTDLTGVHVIMLVHVFGFKIDQKVFDWCIHKGLKIVEDLAEAHGILPKQYSYAACWSFYRNKIIAGEEGGMILFPNSADDADYARQLRSLGFTAAHDYLHVPRGINARMSNLHAAAIHLSLNYYPISVQARQEAHDIYTEKLSTHDGIQCYKPEANWFFVVNLSKFLGDQRLDLKSVYDLVVKDVPGIRYGFQPVTRNREYYHDSCQFSNAFRRSISTLLLPLCLKYRNNCKYVADSFIRSIRYLETGR